MISIASLLTTGAQVVGALAQKEEQEKARLEYVRRQQNAQQAEGRAASQIPDNVPAAKTNQPAQPQMQPVQPMPSPILEQEPAIFQQRNQDIPQPETQNDIFLELFS